MRPIGDHNAMQPACPICSRQSGLTRVPRAMAILPSFEPRLHGMRRLAHGGRGRLEQSRQREPESRTAA